ncbi:MAG: GNAT family N-acetyltransferase [Planctomycetota bacterium]
MIHYRRFLNTDPPLISEIWKNQKPLRGQVSSISRLMLDHHVYAKTYFDPEGYLLAIDENESTSRPLGFVHAGFAVNESHSDLNQKIGIICQLKVVPGEKSKEVAHQLMKLALDYLSRRGVKEIHAATCFPHAPFYAGLYGGSRIPGVLSEDADFVESLKAFAFEEFDRIGVYQRELFGFKPYMDRIQRVLTQKYQINAIADPLERNWWESCTLGLAEREQFTVCPKAGSTDSVCGHVLYWDMQPLANHWGVNARGLYDLSVNQDSRGRGLATFLVGQSLKYLMQQGIGLVEAQTPISDQAAVGVFKKLEFDEVARGILMKKKA